jgi:hypothetical protein
MSYLFDDIKILPNTINGDTIIKRDFKDKNIIFRVEIANCIDEDFYRDGENSGFDYTFDISMYVITKSDNDYTLYTYNSKEIEAFSRRLNKFDAFDNEKIIYFDNNNNITLSELENMELKDNNNWWSKYKIAKMSGDKDLFIRMRILAKKIWKQRKNNKVLTKICN